MWRYAVAAFAAVGLLIGGWLIFADRRASAAQALTETPPPAATEQSSGDLPSEAPRASDRTREEKRFDRYDKDRNQAITREEYLASRRKAYARLDKDGDGRLSFDEWAVKATGKFAGADSDRSGTLTRTEFATTAVKRKAAPRCACPPAGKADDDD